MTDQNTLGKLDEKDWDRLQGIVERYEADCLEKFPRALQRYLPPKIDPIRDVLLTELVCTDMELRWKNREGVLAEFYFSDFPELEDSRDLQKILSEEIRCRQRYANSPTLDEYEHRFPALKAMLTEMFASKTAPISNDKTPVIESLSGGHAHQSDFVVPTNGDSISQTMSGSFAMTTRYKRVRKIGRGAFGEVWEAEAPGGIHVAIKQILQTISAKAIERERSSLDLICSGRLRHPFLLQVFGWWINKDRLHIVMELADGSLEEKLKAAQLAGKTGLEPNEIRQVLIDAADALDYLNHRSNIVHRDVKPANMLLMADRLKLCDFGLSRMSEKLGRLATMGAGTPVFMAPEVINGEQSLNSDQYSLATSYFMLRTGKPVFRGIPNAIREQHLNAQPNLDTGILSDAEQSVLKKALSKLPEDRFATNSEFVGELLAATDGSTNPRPRSSPSKRVLDSQPGPPAKQKTDPDIVTPIPSEPPRPSAGDDRTTKATDPPTPEEIAKMPQTIESGLVTPKNIPKPKSVQSPRSNQRWQPLRPPSSGANRQLRSPSNTFLGIDSKTLWLMVGVATLAACLVAGALIAQL